MATTLVYADCPRCHGFGLGRAVTAEGQIYVDTSEADGTERSCPNCDYVWQYRTGMSDPASPGAINKYIVTTLAGGAVEQLHDIELTGTFGMMIFGGVAPYVVTIPAPAQLPPGVNDFSGTYGQAGDQYAFLNFSGAGTVAGTYNVTTQIRDAKGGYASRTVQIVIDSGL